MSTIKEKVRCWLLLPQTGGISSTIDDILERVDSIEQRFNGLELAHRKLLERVMELELKVNYQSVSSTHGKPPPGMEDLRPAYRSRQSLINEAQGILDLRMIPEKKEVDEHGQVKHA